MPASSLRYQRYYLRNSGLGGKKNLSRMRKKKKYQSDLLELKSKPLSIAQKDKLFSERFKYVRQYFDDLETENILPTVQDKYLFGLCRPERLMDIIFNFILFDNGEKKIARYQQFFAIKKSMKRILQFKEGRTAGRGYMAHSGQWKITDDGNACSGNCDGKINP